MSADADEVRVGADVESDFGDAPPQPPGDAAPAPRPAGERLLPMALAGDFARRWIDVQIDFVENPRGSVESADALLEEVIGSLVASIEQRRAELGEAWRDGKPDTEQLRLTLQRYRAFVRSIVDL